MRYLLTSLLLAFVVLSSGCDPDPDGYSCNSEGCCYAAINSQYLTLGECLNDCYEVTPKPVSCGAPVHDGYTYSTVQIGDQCWFAENLRYLPIVSPSSEGSGADPYYYVYDYEGSDVEAAKATDKYETYGVLYNWPAVMTKGICPSGWHIPSYEEFTQLTDFLCDASLAAGGKMKEAGYEHWLSPNTGATNSSGWTGLPGSSRYTGYFYGDDGYNGYWWTATEVGPSDAAFIWLNFNLRRGGSSDISPREIGFSARCVRD